MPAILPTPAPIFKQRSRAAARRFLQTAMLFDDNATFEELKISIKAEDVNTPNLTGPEEIETPSEEGTAGTAQKEKEKETERKMGENLYAKAINDAFAEEGIVCGVIKPKKDDITALNAIKKAARRADIVVVDWFINDDKGETALNVIEGILSEDKAEDGEAHQGRLRLLAIYTSEPDLATISLKVKTKFGFKNTANNTKGRYTLALNENVRLCIYQKDRGSKKNIGPNKERVVSDSNLPGKLIEDFSDMTSGLLFNLVLNALGALRENTHRLIQKFNKSVDAPYFSHRVLSDPMEDTLGHPLSLFTAEIEDILLDQEVNRYINEQAVAEWLEYLSSADALKFPTDTSTKVLDALKGLNQTGIVGYVKKNNPSGIDQLLGWLKSSDQKGEVTKLTSAFTKNVAEANSKDREFAALTTFRSHYRLPPPQLKLGSVVCVKERGKQKYLICVQPVCDSVRLKKPDTLYPFPFIEMVEVTGASDGFDLTLKHNKKQKQFVIQKKPSKMRLLEFKADAVQQAVVATQDQTTTNWFFQTATPKKLEWIGELRFPHAQRVAANLATELSRVGLTESEWTRRAAKKIK
ncbi:hypothetical protein SAMN02745146_3084 [Hymenobacter daecheongensis DSM 21074]|uniref:Response receiver domain-containing protein n=1 Tax=Hymenobacter daecheongensis DSM 21074 TaxID=1121955 RepID=A0A1M6J3V4_9BACT|nr:response regulator receiver domain [Hymenobacter daecheongensis]SHJ41359.1 hypothetical protein SAMN02745146_3084 [Hymenobacter daecheongensis DSM 21074]